MAEAAISAIGLFSGVLGIVSFFETNLGTAQPEGATVGIKAGLGSVSSDEDNWGGTISAVYAYNNVNEFLGESAPVGIGDGGFETTVVSQAVGGAQPGFISLANGNDATCVQWVTVTSQDGLRSAAWTGDIGESCGQRSFYGIEEAGRLPNGEVWIPFCTWLDADGSGGTQSAAMKFRIGAYGADVQSTLDSGNSCGSTIFAPDEGPIAAAPAKHRRAADVIRPQSLVETLVVSDIANQTAEWLCAQPHTWGPDFVGVDGKYCDMGTKQLFPLCSTEDVDGCINLAEPEKTVTKQLSVARRPAEILQKSYRRVIHNY